MYEKFKKHLVEPGARVESEYVTNGPMELRRFYEYPMNRDLWLDFVQTFGVRFLALYDYDWYTTYSPTIDSRPCSATIVVRDNKPVKIFYVPWYS